MRLVALLVILTASLVLALPSSFVHASTSSSQSLVVTTQTYTFTQQPSLTSPFMPDDKTVYSFSPSGIFSFQDARGGNFTVNPPTNFVATQLAHNSTTVSIFLTFGSYNLTIYFKTIPKSYNLKITIKGFNPNAFSVPVAVPFLNFLNEKEQLSSTFVQYGSVGFDWSDSQSFSPVWTNSSQILSWTVPSGSFEIDPLAFVATSVFNGPCVTTTRTCNIDIAPGGLSSANDFVYLWVATNIVSDTVSSITTITCTAGVSVCGTNPASPATMPTWTARGTSQSFGTACSGGSGILSQGFWQIATQAYTDIQVQVAFAQTQSRNVMTTVLIFTGEDMLLPFDNNLAAPLTNTANNVTSISVTLTTTNTNDALLTAYASHVIATVPSGFTSQGSNSYQCSGVVNDIIGAATNIVSATQTSKAITWTQSNASIAMVADAIKAPPTVTSISPTSGPKGTAVTITGTNLAGASGATFDGYYLTNFVVVSDTSITGNIPTVSGTPKTDVQVVNGDTSAMVSGDIFTVTAAGGTTGGGGGGGGGTGPVQVYTPPINGTQVTQTLEQVSSTIFSTTSGQIVLGVSGLLVAVSLLSRGRRPNAKRKGYIPTVTTRPVNPAGDLYKEIKKEARHNFGSSVFSRKKGRRSYA